MCNAPHFVPSRLRADKNLRVTKLKLVNSTIIVPHDSAPWQCPMTGHNDGRPWGRECGTHDEETDAQEWLGDQVGSVEIRGEYQRSKNRSAGQ